MAGWSGRWAELGVKKEVVAAADGIGGGDDGWEVGMPQLAWRGSLEGVGGFKVEEVSE